jgi:hypothetical protein|nr:MAG TPA: Long-tail fiber proximal subunit PROTEIN, CAUDOVIRALES, MYOVIRIDAE [Caudoviricetes sp.]
MSIEKFKSNIEDYLHLSTEAGDKGTKIQDWQDYQRNLNATIQNIIGADILWQPNKDLATNNVVRSPNMVAGTYARVTKAGTTAAVEPAWTGVGTTVTDGTVTYVIYPQTIDFATQAEVTAGTNKDKIVTPAMLGQTIQVDLASTKRVNLNEADKSVTPGITGILPVAQGGTGLDHLPYTPNGNNSVWDGTHFPAIGEDGVIEIGSMVDFHEKSGDTADYSLRLSSSGGKLLVNGTDIMSYIANVQSQAGVVAGNVSNANAWWVKLGGTVPLIIQGGYKYVDKRTDVYVPFPVAYSTVLSIVGTPVVNASNSSGKGLENIKTYNTTSFVYYSGYDINYKNLLWLSVGI